VGLRALEQGRHTGQCPSAALLSPILSVPWQDEMVFYYYSNRSIAVGRFKHRVQWQGDVSHWDGSIQLEDVQVNDTGTYVCEIRLHQCSSIFKNHTLLHVSPAGPRGTCPVTAPLSCRPVRPHIEGLPRLQEALGPATTIPLE